MNLRGYHPGPVFQNRFSQGVMFGVLASEMSYQSSLMLCISRKLCVRISGDLKNIPRLFVNMHTHFQSFSNTEVFQVKSWMKPTPTSPAPLSVSLDKPFEQKISQSLDSATPHPSTTISPLNRPSLHVSWHLQSGDFLSSDILVAQGLALLPIYIISLWVCCCRNSIHPLPTHETQRSLQKTNEWPQALAQVPSLAPHPQRG